MPVTFPQSSAVPECLPFVMGNLPWLAQSPEADEPSSPTQTETLESVKLSPQTECSFPVAFGVILAFIFYQPVT